MKYCTAILLLCISVASETALVSAATRARRQIRIDDDNNIIPSTAAAPRRRRILQAKELKEKKVKPPKKKDKEDPPSNDGVNPEIDGNVLPINQAIMDGMDNPLTQFFLEDLKAPSNDQNATIDWGDSFNGSESPSISPSSKPTTEEPSLSPITSTPTTKEPSPVPSPSPTTLAQIIPAVITTKPKTKQPTNKPITASPTNQPSKKPVTTIPTLSPSNKPVTNSPTLKPITTPVSISGVIYNDKNENGRLDSKEDGVGGIIVRAKSCLFDRTVGHAFSKPDGSYILRDVGEPGCYYLQFVDSDRYYFVSPKDGMTENINLKSGEIGMGWNAGVAFYPTEEPTLSPVRLTKSPVTSEPSPSPSDSPVTSKPSSSPSARPTTDKPTNKPSLVPTSKPTLRPTASPSVSPSSKPTLKPSAQPSRSPTKMPITTMPTTNQPSDKPVTNTPSKQPSPKPVSTSPTRNPTSKPSMSSSDQPVTLLPTRLPTSNPVSSSPSKRPSLKPVTESPIAVDESQDIVATANPVSSKPSSGSPTKSPVISNPSKQPSDKPVSDAPTISPITKSEPTVKTTDAPSSLSTDEPTEIDESSSSPTKTPSTEWVIDLEVTSTPVPTPLSTDQPTRSPQTIAIATLPKMSFTLLETQGELSEDAVVDLTSSLDTFYSAKLADYYNKDGEYFQAISLTSGEQSLTTQSVDEESDLYDRVLEEVSGTEVLYEGSLEFIGDAPSSNEIADVITQLSNENNDELVSAIVATDDSELSDVYIVKVAQHVEVSPSSPPSTIREDFLANGVQGSNEVLDKPNAPFVIMMIAGVATLTMLIFIFATRNKRNRDSDDNDEMVEPPTTIVRKHSVAAQQVEHSDIQHDLSAEQSVMSSVTGWSIYGNPTHRYDNTTACDNNEEGLKDGDNLMKSNVNSGGLLSVAAINHTGTKTLEKEDETVMPKNWLSALHGDDESIFSSQQDRGYDGLETSSAEDTSTEGFSGGFSGSNNGGFPTYGAFPTTKTNKQDGDWSLKSNHIGTVDDNSMAKSPTAYIEHTLSRDTTESKTFMKDLIWLEGKVAEQNAKESVEINLRETYIKDQQSSALGALQITDSYSYECDKFISPTSSNSDADSSVTSLSDSHAMSIVCRDVYIPPGNLDLDIVDSKDGPVISHIRDKSLNSHLNVGDLIMSLDDRDTRSSSAEDLAATLSARSLNERKLTLLHFGDRTRE